MQVVLPFAREHPELRAAVLIALFAWLGALAWLWLVRSRPLAAGLLAALPFAVSATVYDLPQYPWRALPAGGLLLAFLFTGRCAGGGRAVAVAFAALALAIGAGWSALPAASRPAVLPWTTWTFSHTTRDDPSGVGLVWDMRYQPLVLPAEARRGAAGARAAAVVLARRRALRLRRPALRARPGAIVATRAPGAASCACRGPPAWRRLRAEIDVEALVDSFLVAPGQPVRYELPPAAGAVDLLEDATAELRTSPRRRDSTTSAEGVDRDPSAAALRVAARRVSRRASRRRACLRRARRCRPSGRPGARA